MSPAARGCGSRAPAPSQYVHLSRAHGTVRKRLPTTAQTARSRVGDRASVPGSVYASNRVAATTSGGGLPVPTPEVLAPFAGPVADDRGTFSTRKLRLPRRRRHVVDGRTAKTSFRWPRTSGMDVEPPRDAIDAPCHYVPLTPAKKRAYARKSSSLFWEDARGWALQQSRTGVKVVGASFLDPMAALSPARG